MHQTPHNPVACPALPLTRSWPEGFDLSRSAPPGRHEEWLLTSGHGGFAMGTPEGIARRKYHAMLIGTTNPPVDRVAVLHWVDVGIRRSDSSIAWCGPEQLRSFERTADSVAWGYSPDGTKLVVRLRLARHQSAARVEIHCTQQATMVLRPWLTLRDFHDVLPDAEAAEFSVQARDGAVLVTRGDELAGWLTVDSAQFESDRSFSETKHYDLETARSLPDAERWFSPGRFIAESDPDGRVLLHAGLGLHAEVPGESSWSGESNRVEQIVRDALRLNPALEGHEAMVAAADQFVVVRTVDGACLASIIAGYPWFADWGRDTMIALPGLLLATARFEEALGCLEAFARHESEGMIPNRFDDYGGPPHYNTVDASLWFIHACHAWARATGDARRVHDALLPACRAIVHHYQSGTRYGIRADPADHLIMAGDETTQLTWMDAKRDGVVFTPRHGKAVEINALWHHALLCVADLTEDADESAKMRELASKVRASFQAAFWDEAQQRLRDCLQLDGRGRWRDTEELRPNQIFAASLEFGPVSEDQRRGIVASVREHLLTPVGLRTLAPSDPKYCPHFVGDMMARDYAYHNGTVWPWLIGGYAEAVLRAGRFDETSRQEALASITPLIASIDAGSLGSIAEIYDAEPETHGGKRRHEGCLAQAWSVAEPLRILAMIHLVRTGA